MRPEKMFLSKTQDLFQFVFVIINIKITIIILNKRIMDLKFQMENILQNDNDFYKPDPFENSVKCFTNKQIGGERHYMFVSKDKLKNI